MTKYEIFADSLRKAMSEGLTEGNKHGNIGFCNLDSVYVYLKGWRKDGILNAAKKAGVYCYKELGRWVFVPKGNGFAYNRTANAQKAASVLKGFGYDAGVIYLDD